AACGASSIAVCRSVEPSLDAKAHPTGLLLPLGGVTAASFDFEGTLWLAVARGRAPELWAAPSAEAPAGKGGDSAPGALVGVASRAAAPGAESGPAAGSLERTQAQAGR